jgi:anti-sigma B factor antagonist
MPEWDAMFVRGSSGAGSPVLAVSGEIDLAVAGRFAKELAALVEESDGEAVVDLSGVGFMDSSGVRELLIANRSSAERGAPLVLVSPSESCRHVLQVSGAWSEFDVREQT